MNSIVTDGPAVNPTPPPVTPTLPLCDGCGQQFPLISMAFYVDGQFCPGCRWARIAKRRSIPSDITPYADMTGFAVADLLRQADADMAATAADPLRGPCSEGER